MKKRMLLLVLVLALGLQICVTAVEPRDLMIIPVLTFSGSTATCTAYIEETDDNSYIVATMTLWANNQVLKTWTQTGMGEVNMVKTASVTKGTNYTLRISVTVNGISKPTQSVSKTY